MLATVEGDGVRLRKNPEGMVPVELKVN